MAEIHADVGFGANIDADAQTAAAHDFRSRQIIAPTKGKKSIRTITVWAVESGFTPFPAGSFLTLSVCRSRSKLSPVSDGKDLFTTVPAGGTLEFSAYVPIGSGPSVPVFRFAAGELECKDGEILTVFVPCAQDNTGGIHDTISRLSVTGVDESDILNVKLR